MQARSAMNELRIFETDPIKNMLMPDILEWSSKNTTKAMEKSEST